MRRVRGREAVEVAIWATDAADREWWLGHNMIR
jgi:hypothetical protein